MPRVDRIDTVTTSFHPLEPVNNIKMAINTGVTKRKPKSPIAWTYPYTITVRNRTPDPSRNDILESSFSPVPTKTFFKSSIRDKEKRHITSTQGINSEPRVLGRFRSGSLVMRNAKKPQNMMSMTEITMFAFLILLAL